MSPKRRRRATPRAFPAKVRILQLTQELDATFDRARDLRANFANPSYDQVHVDYAKLLCVLLSGYLDQSFQAALNERLQLEVGFNGEVAESYFKSRFIDAQNLKVGRILEVLSECSGNWAAKAEEWFNADEQRKTALGTLVSLRNAIAHGSTPDSITYVRMDELRPYVKATAAFIAELVEPTAPAKAAATP